MAFPPTWVHRHVIHECYQTVTGFNKGVNVVRNFRQTVITNCPYGANCPIAFPNGIRLWPPPRPVMCMNLPLHVSTPECIPCPQLLAPSLHDWLSNDIVEFNTPSSAFPLEMRIKPKPAETGRGWEHIGYENWTDSSQMMKFKLMAYNVLSQMILDSNKLLYNSCRKENLVWETRWEKIFNEVITIGPDIFCLQEVQASHTNYFARFQAIGYLGIFKKKTEFKGDGCAVFYKDEMFQMIDKLTVELKHENVPLLRADSIGIVVKLAPRASPNTHLVVATTHLLYMPDEAPTRLAQMRVFLNEIDKFAYDETKGHLPVIVAGDFNSLSRSNVIKFLNEGQICIPVQESLEHIGLSETRVEINIRRRAETGGETSTSNGATVAPANPVQTYVLAKHPFSLSSVYEIDNGHDRWDTVDHIYFTNSDLSALQRLSPPSTSMRRKIPNEIYGSDHMSIAAVFEMHI